MSSLIGSSNSRGSLVLYVINSNRFLGNQDELALYYDPIEKEAAAFSEKMIKECKNGRFLPLHSEVMLMTKDGYYIVCSEKSATYAGFCLPRTPIMIKISDDNLHVEDLISKATKQIIYSTLGIKKTIEFKVCDDNAQFFFDKEQNCHLIFSLVQLSLCRPELSSIINNQDIMIVSGGEIMHSDGSSSVSILNFHKLMNDKKSTSSVPKKSLLKANAHLG